MCKRAGARDARGERLAVDRLVGDVGFAFDEAGLDPGGEVLVLDLGEDDGCG